MILLTSTALLRWHVRLRDSTVGLLVLLGVFGGVLVWFCIVGCFF